MSTADKLKYVAFRACGGAVLCGIIYSGMSWVFVNHVDTKMLIGYVVAIFLWDGGKALVKVSRK